MRRDGTRARVLLASILVLAFETTTGLAQRKIEDVLPLDLKTSKTAFLSFAGVNQNAAEEKINSYSDGAAWLYAECYQDLSNLGRFTLLKQPTNADLILEVKLEDTTQASPSFGGTTQYSATDPRLLLRIIDRKTGVLLWTLIKHVEFNRKEADRDRNLKKAVSDLVADLTALTQPPQTP